MRKIFISISVVAIAVAGYFFWFLNFEKPKQDKLNRKGQLLIDNSI